MHEVELDFEDITYTVTNVDMLENAREERDDTNFFHLMFIRILY